MQRNVLYVGGHAQQILHAIFVTFLERKDVVATIDNMDGAELNGRLLTINYTLPKEIEGGKQGWVAKPI